MLTKSRFVEAHSAEAVVMEVGTAWKPVRLNATNEARTKIMEERYIKWSFL